jgi:hypothetical protein
MKLWATVDLQKLPHILQNGLDNPTCDEIHFSNNVEVVANTALESEGELAFIETEIPDDELDNFFVRCLASHGDYQTDMESELSYAESKEQVAQITVAIKAMEEAESARELLDVFGYACLYQPIPPAMLKLLDPEKMVEAVHSGDTNAIANAVQNSEATAFKSLNAAFWVWLMFLLKEIFGPGYGLPEQEDVCAEEEEGRLERMREAAAKRPRKKRAKKKVPKA